MSGFGIGSELPQGDGVPDLALPHDFPGDDFPRAALWGDAEIGGVFIDPRNSLNDLIIAISQSPHLPLSPSPRPASGDRPALEAGQLRVGLQEPLVPAEEEQLVEALAVAAVRHVVDVELG